MKTMKPKEIKDVLNLARAVRAQGGNYVPCFAGDAGIGKSEVNQQWAKEQEPDFGFLDVRLSYMEGPDLIGMPQSIAITDGNGKTIYTTIHSLPDFLPRGGSGLLLFEEPNRAHESTMNAMMQILTDRKIHGYELPSGWIMAACINPEGRYTVNTMDPALKNRFAMFNVVYDHLSFVSYIKEAKWDADLVAFIDKHWIYKNLDEIGDSGKMYVSPRSWKQVNAMLSAGGRNTGLLYGTLLTASVGDVIASDFIKFEQNYRPITLMDILSNPKEAKRKLKEMSDSSQYDGDRLSLTVTSVAEGFQDGKISEELLVEVSEVLTPDQGINLLVAAIRTFQTEAEGDAFIQRHKKALENVERRQHGKINKE